MSEHVCIYIDVNEWDDRFAIQYDCFREVYIESDDPELRRALEQQRDKIKELLDQLVELLIKTMHKKEGLIK